MIWIDYTIVGLLSIGVGIGYLQGIRRAAFFVVFWLFGLWVALNFSKEFSLFLVSRVDSLAERLVLSFIALLVITLLLGSLIGLLLGPWVSPVEVGFFGQLGGTFFGFIQAVLLITCLVVMAGFTPLPKDLWWQESKFLPRFKQAAVILRNQVSSGITENLNYQ